MERPKQEKVEKGSILRAVPYGLIAIAGILIVVAVLTYTSQKWQSEQKITNISIEGSNILSESDILIMLKDSVLGKVYADIDIESIDRILQENPYIIKSRITTDAKGKLKVEVTERKPVAVLIKHDGSLAYSDETGFTFPYVPLETTDNIPIIGNLYFNGRLNSKALKSALKIVSEMAHEGYDIIISRINHKSGDCFETITSDYGVKLIIDASHSLDEQLKKYKRFTSSNERTLMLAEVKYLDLRWTNRLVAGY